jgi:hypothetical protein
VPVTVTPEEFTMVGYEADRIRELTEEVAAKVGLDPSLAIAVAIDETTPLGVAKIESVDPVTLSLESGAVEDPKRPRELSDDGAQNVLGRLLFQVTDRLDPDFGAPALDEELSLELSNAWDTYAAGRLHRLGFRYYDQYKRRLYHFRNRHGFTDAADEAFHRLWNGEGLTWADIEQISAEALAARPAA